MKKNRIVGALCAAAAGIVHRRALIVLGLAVCVLLAEPAAAQSIRYVRTNGPNNGDGTSWTNAYNKVYKALDAAIVPGSGITQIWIASGTHKPVRSGNNRDDAFALVPGVTLYGGFNGSETQLSQRDPALNITILSGDLSSNDGAPGTPGAFTGISDNSRHVITALNFVAGSAQAVLDGLTIRSGNADFPSDQLLGGGGMFIQSAKVKLVNCTFTACNAGINQPAIGGFGGAIYNYGGELEAIDCLITHNRGDNGGSLGVRDFNGSTVHTSFTDCQFLNNTAMNQSGGAVWTGVGPFDTTERSLTFRGCLFENNQAQYGGAITEQNIKHVKLIDCTFRNNESFVVGGAVWHSQTGGPDQEPIEITRCLFIDNTTSDGGGAFFGTATGQVITNCVFLNNRALEGVGGAVRSGPQFGTNFGVGDITIANSVFSGNFAEIGGTVAALRNPNARIANCTFANNSATFTTGGVFSDAFSLRIDNTILWQNSAGGIFNQTTQIFHSTSFGPQSTNNSCVQGLDGSLGGRGNTGLDPKFVDDVGLDEIAGTIDDDVRVDPRSPVIDVADASAIPADVPDLDADSDVNESLPLDLDELPRIASAGPDMGAYEIVVPFTPGDATGDGVVNIDDLLAVLNAWGACLPPCPADLDGNGVVDIDDLLNVIGNWS